MLVKNCMQFSEGFNSIINAEEITAPTHMDFGILNLKGSSVYRDTEQRERVFLLLRGSAVFEADDRKMILTRGSYVDENPSCMHVDSRITVRITTTAPHTEIIIVKTLNDKYFEPVFYFSDQCRTEERGKGTMNETATRIVRTIFDKSNAPLSNLVLGEVIAPPGKWSSYPPHFHVQPEIYHYRFMPENGFGYAGIGDEVFKIAHKDTIKILGSRSHPQVAAPGYVMYYTWVIRHLESAPYIQPIFEPEHMWLLEKNSDI